METLKEEQTIAIFRKTFLFVFAALAKTAFLIVVPTVIFYYLGFFDAVKIAYYVFMAFTALYFLSQILKWYFSSLIVTTKRLIKTEQRGLFSREVSEISFRDVYSVNYCIQGALATIFNYGDIILEIKNTNKRFYIKDLQSPTVKRDLILKAREEN